MGYYYCKICGNVIHCPDNCSSTLTCCGEKMHKCEENKEDMNYGEKHIPVYSIDGTKVCVKAGSTLHPSGNEHYIVFIELTTDKGNYTRIFKPGEIPECCFYLGENEKPLYIRLYCNIHGLWRRDISD